ncbi:MAG: class IV adenylate cyclase [Acidobacteria bacterium]|nr:class IV adenylate cyclase [Acidobacteriota bacterium]
MTRDAPAVERELKFSLDELEALRERLIELDAERVNPGAFEDNWVLDRDDELKAKGCLLRLRKDGQGAVITFKGPASFDGGVKERTESETRVGNLEEARRLFEQLGYHAVRRYQKVREEWYLGAVTIALDHTPIGDFVEFEGSGAETVAKRCGFDLTKAERHTYLEIYDERVRQDPTLPREMVFPDKD